MGSTAVNPQNPQYSDLPPGAEIVSSPEAQPQGQQAQFSDLPPGAQVISAPQPQPQAQKPRSMDEIRATARANMAAQAPRLPTAGQLRDAKIIGMAGDIAAGEQIPGTEGIGRILRRPFQQQQQAQPAQPQTPRSPYAKPGSYTTQLSPDDETKFQQWVGTQKTDQGEPVWRDQPNADYDMRGFWKAMTSGDPEAQRDAQSHHFPDKWKTPYHSSFSNESQYATADAPKWINDFQLQDRSKKIVFDERYQPFVQDAAEKYKLPEGFIRSVISQESDFDPNVPDEASGDRGIMQITPQTAKQYGIDYSRLHDPAYAIDSGAKILHDLVNKFGDYTQAAFHYNANKNVEAGSTYAKDVMTRFSGGAQAQPPASETQGPLKPPGVASPKAEAEEIAPSRSPSGWGPVVESMGERYSPKNLVAALRLALTGAGMTDTAGIEKVQPEEAPAETPQDEEEGDQFTAGFGRQPAERPQPQKPAEGARPVKPAAGGKTAETMRRYRYPSSEKRVMESKSGGVVPGSDEDLTNLLEESLKLVKQKKGVTASGE